MLCNIIGRGVILHAAYAQIHQVHLLDLTDCIPPCALLTGTVYTIDKEALLFNM